MPRVSPEQVDFFLHPQFDRRGSSARPIAEATRSATGLNVSPGAAVGQVALDADTGRALGEARAARSSWSGRRPSRTTSTACSPREGILTSRGGRTSHAALVARQFGKPAVVGVADARDRPRAAARSTVGGQRAARGRLDLDRRHAPARSMPASCDTSCPTSGPVPRRAARLGRRVPPPRVWANADYPADAQRARELRRAGHRPVPHRAHVLRARAAAASCSG